MGKKVLLAMLVVLAGFIGFVTWDSHDIEKRAESFLAEWSDLKLGDGPEQARAMSDQFRPRYSRTSEGCNTTECTYSFGFYNAWISRLHLAPIRAFGGRVIVKNGQIVYKELVFEQGKFLQVFFQVRDVDCYPCKDAPKPYNVSSNGFHFYVTLTPASTPEERAISYRFNLSLLASLRRFNPRDLQPAVIAYLDRQIAEGKI